MTLAAFDRLRKQDFESATILADIRNCIRTLEFYANRESYTEMDKIKRHMTRVESDFGYAARKALGLERPK